MKVTKNRETDENKEFWDSVEKTRDEVRESFPTWKMSNATLERFKIHSKDDQEQKSNSGYHVTFD